MPLSFVLLSLAAADAAINAGHYQEGYEKARQAAEQYRQAADFTSQSRALNLMGNARYYLGDYPNAILHYQQALATARQANAPDIEINALNNTGNVHYFLGEYAEAWNSYQEAAEAVDRNASAPWAERLRLSTAVNQATLLQRVGKDNEAMQIYRRVRESASKLSPAAEGQFLANLGALYRRLGDPVKAMELYDRALTRFQAANSTDGVITTLKNKGIAQALEFSDLAAARSSFLEAGKRAEHSGNKPQLSQTHLYLAETASRAKDPAEAVRQWTSALRLAEELHAKEDQWKALYGLGRLKEAVEVIESLRPTLDRGEFLTGKRAVYDAYIESLPETPNPEAIFYWIERTRARRFRDTGAPATLAGVQKQLDPEEVLVSCWTAKCVWITRRASGIAASPLALPALGAKRMIIVPDFKSPVSAWDQALLENFEVSYLPTSTLLRMSKAAAQWRPTALVVAGVDAHSAKGLPGDQQLPDLPHSLGEAHSIGRDLSATLVQTKLDVQSKAAQFSVLHFATHALADRDDPQRSRLILSDAPLFLSEIEKLNLGQVRLATLSACRTAEGNDSLAYGFLRAGAQTVVATLSPVNDQAAAEFMRQFYDALARGETKVQALRSAKLRLKNSGGELSDPRYWAPFVLYGDAAGQVVRPVPWLWAAAGLAGAVAVLIKSAKAAKARRQR